MFGSVILEIVIGLIFVYLLLSLLATLINEIIANFLSLRGRNLKKIIAFMFEQSGSKFDIKEFYKDPQIKKLSSRPHLNRFRILSPPDYLAKDLFSKILMEWLFESEKSIISMEDLNRRIDDKFSSGGEVNRILKRLARDAAGNLEQFRIKLEAWYDDIMNVATEWYKSKVRVISFFTGLFICVAFNADTFLIVKHLSVDTEARNAIVKQAEAIMPTSDKADSSDKNLKAQIEKLQTLKRQLTDITAIVGMGWQFTEADSTFKAKRIKVYQEIPKRVFGWLLTALAISLGAPFWFDMLSKVLNLKHAAQKPVEEKAEQSQPVG